MSILNRLFGNRRQKNEHTEDSQKSVKYQQNLNESEATQKNEHLMISQYAAFFVYQNSEAHKKQYINKLISLGYDNKEAESLLNFECDTLRKYNKRYLLHPNFTQMWFFGLAHPLFLDYPKEKEDILKEHYLTLSELCKIIDEAEWHFWNSHERQMPDEVWAEIYAWHLKGQGGEFAIKYFKMVAMETGIPEEKIGRFSSNEGRHLSLYKWR